MFHTHTHTHTHTHSSALVYICVGFCEPFACTHVFRDVTTLWQGSFLFLFLLRLRLEPALNVDVSNPIGLYAAALDEEKESVARAQVNSL